MKHSYSTNFKANEIDRRIINLAWPAILSNISVPILGLSDTFISGHLGSERYLAAMAVSTTMINSLYWLFGFLRMGTTGLTANSFGAEDEKAQDVVFTRATTIAMIAGLLLILVAGPAYAVMAAIMEPPAEVAGPAKEYFNIIMLSAPATLATMAASGRLIGRQNTLYPMIIAVTVNIFNILLSLALVFVFGMGFKGIAVGTTSANWMGLLLALYLVARQSGNRLPVSSLRPAFRGNGMARFFAVNGFLFVRSACMMSVTFGMTAFASRIGTTALAVNAVMIQFFIFFSYFMDGFAFSGEALCGGFLGAKDYALLRLTVRRLCIIGAVIAVVFAAIYGGFAPQITSLLSDSANVKEIVAGLRIVCVLLPIASVAAFIFDGVFVGLTRTSDMMLSTMGGMAIFFSSYLIAQALGATPTSGLLWTSFLTFLLTRGLVLAIRLRYLYSHMPNEKYSVQ